MIALFDVGATRTRIGLSTDGKTLAERKLEPTPQTKTGWHKLVEQAETMAGKTRITAAAAGLPGIVNQSSGLLLNPGELTGWNGLDLRPALQKLTGQGRICIENDVALDGLGEAHFGSTGLTEGIMAYVTVSSGVNGVRIVDGRIDRKARGFEIGRQLLMERGSGDWATLEELIGGRSMQHQFGRLPKTIDDPAVWKTETKYFAVGLYNLIMHWSPDVIVLGGSMMRDIPLDRLADELAALPPAFNQLPKLLPATLGDWGGLYGGLALLSQN